MKELSLFSGAGGGLLGSLLLGWTPIGYVEWNKYAQKVIAKRIEDGIFPAAPIFSDIREFASQGYAASYTGLVDIVTGGFPCQPFSIAGKQLGADDPRNMWPTTIEVIRIVKPRFVFLENVPGLLRSGYFGTVLKDLSESGYDTRWKVLSAAELGAPHQRDRLWIVAYTKSTGTRENKHRVRSQSKRFCEGDTPRQVADTESKRLSLSWGGFGVKEEYPILTYPSWWEVEPNVGRVVDGMAGRTDRLKAIGNGQVPAVVRAAWLILSGQVDIENNDYESLPMFEMMKNSA